jgi:hypothetical protein
LSIIDRQLVAVEGDDRLGRLEVLRFPRDRRGPPAHRCSEELPSATEACEQGAMRKQAE